MQPETILAFVLERLPKPGDPHFHARLEQVAEGASVPFHTLLKVAKGETMDPRVSTVQSLHDYFRAQEARAA